MRWIPFFSINSMFNCIISFLHNCIIYFPQFYCWKQRKECDPFKQDICAATYKIKPAAIFLVRSSKILIFKTNFFFHKQMVYYLHPNCQVHMLHTNVESSWILQVFKNNNQSLHIKVILSLADKETNT